MVVHLFRKCSDAVTASLLGNRFESGFEHPDRHPFMEDGGSQAAYVNFIVLFLRLRDIHSRGSCCRYAHALETAEAGRCRLQTVGTDVSYRDTH